MVFCSPITSSLLSNNDTIINSNITLTGDEVGKVESIKFRDGTQCLIDGDQTNEDFIQHRGMCITGRCQVRFFFQKQNNLHFLSFRN